MSSSYEEYNFIKNQKRLRFWRLASFTIVIISLLSIAFFFFKKDNAANVNIFSKDYIARIHIDGVIIDEDKFSKRIEKLAEDKSLKAAVIFVNSPGGTTVDSEILYDSLYKLGKKKPIVTVMHNVAASGGYIVSLASDYIIARQNTITGSIGVMLQSPNIEGLLQNIGVGFNQIKSTKIKGEPSIHSKLSDEARKNLEAIVSDTYDWFKNLVRLRRKNMTEQQFIEATNGGVFSGIRAVNLGLVDSLGGEEKALKWLEESRDIDISVEIKDIKPIVVEPKDLLSGIISSFWSYVLGNDIKNIPNSGLFIDGLYSVWQSNMSLELE